MSTGKVLAWIAFRRWRGEGEEKGLSQMRDTRESYMETYYFESHKNIRARFVIILPGTMMPNLTTKSY